MADALRPVDVAGARAAEQETAWRSDYLVHFRRLVEAGIGGDAAVTIARAGLDSLLSRLVVVTARPRGPLADWSARDAGPPRPRWSGRGSRRPELSVPFHGRRLQGDELRRQVDAWIAAGVVEPTVADAVGAVCDHPEWLRLEGRTVAVLGAGAEMGPLVPLLRWGARVAAVDLPRPAIWTRLLGEARRRAGRLLLPSRGRHRAGPDHGRGRPARRRSDRRRLARRDRRRDQLVVGNYVYADGATNVRVATAVDVLSTRLLGERADTALAFLATPTDVFAVPADAVRAATDAYDARSRTAKVLGRPLRSLSGGRLLRRAYVAGADPGINDSLIPQQGPELRAGQAAPALAGDGRPARGSLVSMNVAPPTRTRSVVKNRALAAAYAGAHRFGVEVFEPATSNVLMAALLVHDLHTGGGPTHEQPWQDEAYAAVHGGLWRTAYAPRSILGMAALFGWGAARR